MLKLDLKKIRDALEADRQKLDVSQRTYTKRYVKISQSQYSKILAGQHQDLKTSTLLKICDGLNVPLDYFIKGRKMTKLMQRLDRICVIVRDPDFPFGEDTAMELLAYMVDKIAQKSTHPPKE
jgi:transcriptional regulator with XRE-family HTH domain